MNTSNENHVCISQIHPINAQYLLDTEPRYLYGDAGGSLLELAVARFAHTVLETLYDHGGIIALRYHDATTNGEKSFEGTYILRSDGHIRPFQSSTGELIDTFDIDIFYMLLNPVDMNNWIRQDPKLVQIENERIDFGRFGLGISLETRLHPINNINSSIARTRELYLRNLK